MTIKIVKFAIIILNFKYENKILKIIQNYKNMNINIVKITTKIVKSQKLSK